MLCYRSGVTMPRTTTRINRLIEKMWNKNAIQDARHHELGLEKRQGIFGIIQAIRQQNAQFGSKAERANSK